MTQKTTGRNRGHGATPKATDKRNRIALTSRIKAFIVGAACWGLLPVALAEWIIRRLRAESE